VTLRLADVAGRKRAPLPAGFFLEMQFVSGPRHVMKIPIDDVRVLDLDAATVPCRKEFIDGVRHFVFDCPHCQRPHLHGPAEGHREAHCNDLASPYGRSGYNLALIQGD
jgi:hypothetical protein